MPDWFYRIVPWLGLPWPASASGSSRPALIQVESAKHPLRRGRHVQPSSDRASEAIALQSALQSWPRLVLGPADPFRDAAEFLSEALACGAACCGLSPLALLAHSLRNDDL
jgi:hypothetical protein